MNFSVCVKICVNLLDPALGLKKYSGVGADSSNMLDFKFSPNAGSGRFYGDGVADLF